jgi:hypothetical protein
MLAATWLPSCSRRPQKYTFAPSPANARAVASPMPEVAPVISTTLPSNRPPRAAAAVPAVATVAAAPSAPAVSTVRRDGLFIGVLLVESAG